MTLPEGKLSKVLCYSEPNTQPFCHKTILFWSPRTQNLTQYSSCSRSYQFALLSRCSRFKSGSKGQTKSKQFFQADVSSKKRTNEFYFTTMKPQVDLFSFVFGGNWRHQKDISKLTDLYQHQFWCSAVSPLYIFSIIQPLFLQKTKPSHPHLKYLFGIRIWIWP